jgi:hypothetical protein
VTGVALQLVRGEGEVANPATGELLTVSSATTDELAGLRLLLSQLRREIDDANRMIDVEIARRMDRENEREAVIGGIGVKVNAPNKMSWDFDKLLQTLQALVDDGRLAAGAAARAVERVVTYKARTVEMNKLLRHDDAVVRDEVAACRVFEPQARRAQITPPAPTTTGVTS